MDGFIQPGEFDKENTTFYLLIFFFFIYSLIRKLFYWFISCYYICLLVYSLDLFVYLNTRMIVYFFIFSTFIHLS